MKTKLFFLSLLTVFMYFSCEDSTISEIGTSIMPDRDKIEVYDTVIPVTLNTFMTDSIYAKTISGTLGEYYDPTFGTLNAGFACQFYPSIVGDSLHRMIDGKIDSVFLDISYSFMGDSLTPMELTVYPVIKSLEKNYYTTVNPEQFADLSHPVGKFAYTANNTGMLSVPLPPEWGQKYMDAFKNNRNLSLEDFIKMFPGFYVKSTFGSGSLLFINSTAVYLQYRTLENGQSYLGDDSIRQRYAYWAVTKEVIQVNSYKNTNLDYLFRNDSTAYIKSPAGVFTELTIPIPEIIQKIGNRQFSSVKLSLTAYPRNEWNYSLNFPGLGTYNSTYTAENKLLLILPDSVKNFFEQQKVADNVTAYTTVFVSSKYTYDFSNISNLIRYAIDHHPNEALRLWLIPIQTSCTYNSSTGGYVDYATAYDLYPSGVALKSKDQEISIIASDLQINK